MPAPTERQPRPSSQRRLGLPATVVLGLAPMVGAGVFTVWGPAADAAGSGRGLLAALAIAGIVAYCNARSCARLDAARPQPGPVCLHGADRLHPAAAFAAGWGFAAGRTAAVAAVALILGHHLLPDHPRALGIAALLALFAVNLLGVGKSTVAAAVFAFAAIAVIAGATGPVAVPGQERADPQGVLTAAGFISFAFAPATPASPLSATRSDAPNGPSLARSRSPSPPHWRSTRPSPPPCWPSGAATPPRRGERPSGTAQRAARRRSRASRSRLTTAGCSAAASGRSMSRARCW